MVNSPSLVDEILMTNEFASTSGIMLRILPPVILYPTEYPSTLIDELNAPCADEVEIRKNIENKIEKNKVPEILLIDLPLIFMCTIKISSKML